MAQSFSLWTGQQRPGPAVTERGGPCVHLPGPVKTPGCEQSVQRGERRGRRRPPGMKTLMAMMMAVAIVRFFSISAMAQEEPVVPRTYTADDCTELNQQ